MFEIHILIFLLSCAALAFSSRLLVDTVSKISKFLGWKEFVVACFAMAFGVSVPNFFVGIISALNGVPELSFGDVVGGNIVDLSLVIGLAALVSRAGLSAPSRTVQGGLFFTVGIAVLPLILISNDRILSRWDGIILFMAFFAYVFWFFSKKERFTKTYDEVAEKITLKIFFKNLMIFLVSLALLLLAAKGMVSSATFFANYFNFPIALIGILIVGLGNSLPEAFFSIHAARKGHDWVALGDLMGGVVVTATLVLGTVALIHPIEITDFSAIAIGRAFLIIAAIFFFIFLRTDKKITRKEALILLGTYVAFVLVEIFAR